MAAFLKDKQAREAALEAEKEAQRKEKEAEAKRLLAMQQRALDSVAEKHAVAARRQQEAIERALRQQEADKAARQAQSMAEVNRARAEQIKAKEYHLALQSAAEQADFERIVRVQAELARAEEEKQQTEKARQRSFAVGIRDQIKETEAQRRQNRDACVPLFFFFWSSSFVTVPRPYPARSPCIWVYVLCLRAGMPVPRRGRFFEEGAKLDQEAQARRARLDAIKQRKLEELKAEGLDPKFLHGVTRAVEGAGKGK